MLRPPEATVAPPRRIVLLPPSAHISSRMRQTASVRSMCMVCFFPLRSRSQDVVGSILMRRWRAFADRAAFGAVAAPVVVSVVPAPVTVRSAFILASGIGRAQVIALCGGSTEARSARTLSLSALVGVVLPLGIAPCFCFQYWFRSGAARACRSGTCRCGAPRLPPGRCSGAARAPRWPRAEHDRAGRVGTPVLNA